MVEKYVISEYKTDTDEYPTADYVGNNLKNAEARFTKIAERKCKSVVLYNAQEDEILKIAIHGEPIFLARAITRVREYLSKGKDTVVSKTKQGAAKAVISGIAKALAGEVVPGIGDVILSHFLGPYYALQGDGLSAASTAAGMWGSVSGAIIGTVVGGPVGGVAGGIIGGVAAGTGTSQIIKAYSHPHKCVPCDGTGLVGNFQICQKCQGYGYERK